MVPLGVFPRMQGPRSGAAFTCVILSRSGRLRAARAERSEGNFRSGLVTPVRTVVFGVAGSAPKLTPLELTGVTVAPRIALQAILDWAPCGTVKVHPPRHAGLGECPPTMQVNNKVVHPHSEYPQHLKEV